MKKTLLSLILAAFAAGNVVATSQQVAPAKDQAASASAVAKEVKLTDRSVSAPAPKTTSEPANQTAPATGAETRPPGALSPAAVPQIAATTPIIKDL